MPAPAYPADLTGERAPIMLGYLPGYYEESTHVREIIQAEGLELDDLWAIARDEFPTYVLPATCPAWTLYLWEATLRVPDRSTWTEAERRAAIAAFFTPALTEADVITFLAAQTPTTEVDIDISFTGLAATITTTSTLSTRQQKELELAALRVMPAHMTVTVNGVTVR